MKPAPPAFLGQAALSAFHADVDRDVAPFTRHHAQYLQCRQGCASCCIDDLTVWPLEAQQIRTHYQALLATGTPHGPGACAFLDDDNACRIYPHRPYVCRTQGLPLRWLDTADDGQTVELRDICPLNEPGLNLVDLSPEACWTLGPAEARLAELNHQAGFSGQGRVSLRSLFAGPPSTNLG